MTARDRGFAAGLNSRPRRGRTDAYDLGYDEGIQVANEYLAAGFERSLCGGFSTPLSPVLLALTDPAFVARRKRMFAAVTTASADTHPKDGDVKQAPLVSGAVPHEDAADAQPPSGPSHD